MADQKLWITKTNAKKLTPQDVQDKIKSGTDINAKYEEDITVLMVATSYTKDGVLVQALIDAGANVNFAEGDDECPMTVALDEDDAKRPVLKALLKAGANPNARLITHFPRPMKKLTTALSYTSYVSAIMVCQLKPSKFYWTQEQK